MPVKQLLIFDSGVGGLSIFQEVIKQSSNVNCYYLSDNAYFPYGELDENQLIERLIMLLTEFVKKHPVDIIIIACNSASTVALTSLRASFSMPVVGVVPAIKPASLKTKNGVIGLVATPATIHRDYTKQLVKQFAADKSVLNIGSTALVKLAEDKLQGKTVDKQKLKAIFQPWLSREIRPDTLVLGCTHFPLLKKEISDCFENRVALVDSGEAIAKRVALLLKDEKLESDKVQYPVSYDAFYTLRDEEQCLLERAFINMSFDSFSLFSIKK
ncbi:glutamate racemase [Psychromonas hadalis]|uniref:glutamate racemase n=1 Tax=Psychromonas hadalis TaxID=211669 RepID=UPI0003B3F697|nr:glutamate racemase [Psychromonas hadalis]